MKLQKQAAGLAAAVAMALLTAATPASAEESFSALRSADAEALSPAEMQAITGKDGASIAQALSAAALHASNPTAAATFNTLAAAYAKITVPTAKYIINRVLVRR
jgi:hypothetical protein